MEETEHKILLRLQKGDKEALRTIYVTYSARVRGFAQKMFGNLHDAEDVAHDVFLRLWESRNDIDKVKSLDGWLFRMTKNAVLNVFKHRNVESRYSTERQKGMPVEAEDSTQGLVRLIDREISKMPEQRRMCFLLSRYENMSYKEIAELLNISPKTVQYHISITLSELRTLLAEEKK